jgi:glucose dehydrogenase
MGSDWSSYGGSPEQIRYSSLRQINRENVRQLQVAWTYDTGETGGMQTQPIIVDDVLYGYTPTHKTFALRASTGEHIWTFDPMITGRGPNRGVMYWASENDRRVFAAVDQFVYALDARTGKPVTTFGDNGRVDLRRDLDRDPQGQSVRLTSPGVVYKDLFIIGGRVGEGLPSSPGEFAWQIPLGEYPELVQKGIQNTGSENYGGPIVTAGGLVFIAATNFDKKFRAFDKANGQLLWETTLPFAGNATPATFEASGRQFVVVAAGGGQARREVSGGVYVAFALPLAKR